MDDDPWVTPPLRPVTLAAVAGRIGGRVQDTGGAGRTVTGITQDSRAVEPGDLYVALPGARWHGASFAAQAAARGAAAILIEPTAVPILDGGPGAHSGAPAGAARPLPRVTAPALRSVLGPLASWLHGDPSRAMGLIGVTGTNCEGVSVLLRAV